ncbi:hypothetical protein ACIBAC_43475 [Streptomyces sp. NPDC051362]|uniref:hypothetical protein n=1 Tax=Streptomyces sp. NPDC051362 TaxID=3365651 RepID=UPI0037A2767A
MAEEYVADPGRLRNAIRQIEQVGELIENAVSEFVNAQSATAGWYGKDDRFAQQVGPQAKRESQVTIKTGESVVSAVASVINGTSANIKNIVETQENNLEAITNSAGKQHGGRR